MRAGAVVVASFVIAGAAHASPAVTLDWDPDKPILELDPTLRAEIEGIGATETEVSHSIYALGPHARASIQTSLWRNDRDLEAYGWNLSAHVSRDLGWGIALTVDAALSRMLGGIDRDDGTYSTFSVALTRLFHWSHKRVAWISFGVERSEWFGASPSRIPLGTVVGLHVGTTF